MTATFTATDGLSGFGSSGDHTTTGTNDSVGEGNPVTVNSPAFTDAAGNTVTAGTASHDFKIDKTAPTITFTGQSPAKNGNGWNKGNVTLGWSCSDALSGPSPATTSQLVATEGSHQQATGTCADVAGNTASSTDGDVNLDKTNPLLNVSGAADGATFNVCSLPARPAFAPSDALSGVDTQSDSWVKPTTTSGVGTYTYTATATDKAGNMATQSRTYTDTYGTAAVTAVPFLQPINQDGSSRFKLGSTIPVKFQAMCSGAPVSAVVAKMYVKQGDSQPDPGTDEAISTSAATTGNLFRYDGSGQQYIFNLSTKLGYVNPDNTTINSFVQGTWTLTIGLDDGSFRSIKVQLVK